MICREIYDSALHLISQTDTRSDIRDYDERFPYLIATFCGENEWLDDAYRMANGKDLRGDYCALSLEFSDTFPLSDVFASSAAYYVAAMLIVDENDALSDRLFDRYCSKMSTIADHLPAKNGKIKDVYP